MAAPSDSALLQAALAGDATLVDAILSRPPESHSVACGLAIADPQALAELDAQSVNTQVGPNAWPPLLYLLNSRYRTHHGPTDTLRLRIAKALLDLGADPNAGVRESETIRGYRTALGAAIGRARSPDLAKLLLESGADVADGPTLYEGSAMWEAARHRDIESLAILLAANPPLWHACHALPHCLAFDDIKFVRLLLDHNADPNWTMGTWGFKGNCLHEAVVLDTGFDVVEALLAMGADVHFPDRGGRTPLAVATCLRRETHATLLRQHGAKDDEIRNVDHWVSACFANDETRASQLKDPSRLTAIDHVWVCRAVRMGNGDAIRLLLDGGADPNAVDDDGNHALHLAANAGNADAVARLIAAGADTGAVNYAGEVPFDSARRGNTPARDSTVALLAPQRPGRASILYDDPDFSAIFERAADAAVDGDIATLARLLRGNPALATARSPRPHRCTLLHYLGANGIEGYRAKTPDNAVEVIEVLLAAGADPNASCYTYRGGPDETTFGLLTSSGHPRDAGLTVSMVAALAKGGARVADVYTLLVELVDRAPGQVDGFDPRSAIAAQAVVECATLREREMLFALLDAGVDIDSRRGDGATALHQAAIDGDEDLVHELLARGADPLLRDNVYDGTAAGWAYAGGHEQLGSALAELLAQKP
ncbi:MAG: ankyrin repeat domain-containing protein [Gammaproteobacteria bacterium]|nr:ankyrin repeat domain-containing protein [Gammaproteobacteria bacterium]